MEMKRSRVASPLLLLLALPVVVAGAGAPAPPARLELAHPAGGHEVHVSAPAVHARLAIDTGGRGIVVWEDSAAVRRRILLRSVAEGGRNLGPVRALSTAIRAWAPDVAVVEEGRR
jgi:hypothetical protein